MIVTRFAPSPTGLLHLGHAYAAMVAREQAKRHGGKFLLRFEDIDHTRIKDEYYAAAREDLAWLGLKWDTETPYQLKRLPRHTEVLNELRVRELIYPCFCTRREVEQEILSMMGAPHGPEGPHYPGICRNLSTAERQDRIKEGSVPAWRLDSQKAASLVGEIFFSDMLHGEIKVDATLLGDVVLGRKDIENSYHLAVVIDDADDGITLVTRGEDLLPSTHIHCTLQYLLGYPKPTYLHHQLVIDENGKRLAKRDDARSLRHYRQSGMSSADVVEMLPPLP